MKNLYAYLIGGVLDLLALVIIWCVDWRLGIAYAVSAISSLLQISAQAPKAGEEIAEFLKKIR